MSKTAFIFPGQGAQYSGMGKDFYENFETAKKVYDMAEEATGLDVAELCFTENDRLNVTEFTQIAMLTTEVAILKVLEERGVRADVCAGLSLGEYGALAAAEVMEEHPDVKIIVVDSLCASMGEGLFVHKAVRLRDEGKTVEAAAQWLKEHALNVVHVFTVEDLFHLHRGGRVSKTAAILGTLASVKPKLHVDNEGHLILIGKVRGRRKSLDALVDYMGEKMGSWARENTEDYIFISHSDALEDAEYVRDKVRERFGIEHCLINHIGPTIGAHTGCGTVAFFFMGESR